MTWYVRLLKLPVALHTRHPYLWFSMPENIQEKGVQYILS
jgi:hypothetical protein